MDAKQIKFFTGAGGSSTLLNNIEAYWKFDESSGTIIDAVNSYDLTPTSILQAQTGKINYCVTLNANTDLMECSTLTGLELTAFSVSAWVNTTDTTTTKNLYSKFYTNFTNYYGIRVAVATSGEFGVTIYTGSGSTSSTVYTSATIHNGSWRHVVVTYASGTANFYIDGSLDSWSPETGLVTPGYYTDLTPLYIGNSYYEDNGFIGSIDEVGVWSRALTSTEVTELYNSGSGKTHPFS